MLVEFNLLKVARLLEELWEEINPVIFNDVTMVLDDSIFDFIGNKHFRKIAHE